ncbi:MAG: sulfur transferase domain-containing protein [SAR86 cluster bacterium]
MRAFCHSLLFLGLIGCSAIAAEVPVKLDPTDFEQVLAQSGSTLLGGQPTLKGLQRVKQAGVRAVISLRTDKEVAKLGFDEAEQARDAGLAFYTIPLSDDASFSPAAVQQFIDLYDQYEGAVLLHCRSGRRVSYLWTAFLVKHQGLDLATAQQHAAAINLGQSPIEGLLGQALELQYSARPE